ncbi:MAG: DUF1015 domain-containing protein [Proteobacteria bacterium]|nr:DUF1015 domain-containing protein [Pseudomonadota bacterium]
MAIIKSFRGFLYNREKIENLKSVVAPPYDVITSQEQNQYYEKHPYNIIRLILGKEEPSDNERENKYTRAANNFSTWRKDRILSESRHPSIYLYTQDYQLPDGKSLQRKGFICRVKLEEFSSGIIRPHEKTLSKPKVDRFNLIKACGANFSPIFSIYSDPECTIEQIDLTGKSPPYLDITDEKGVRHRLWVVDDSEIISMVLKVIKGKNMLIADGHHRYETALNYRNFMREKHLGLGEDAAFNYTMTYLTNMNDAGLVILPTHRLVRDSGFDLSQFIVKAQKYFNIETIPADPERDASIRKKIMAIMNEEAKANYLFAMFCKEQNSYFVFRLKDYSVLDDLMDKNISSALRHLDTNILEVLVFNHLMGISCNDPQYEECFRFIRSDEEAVHLVNTGEYEVAFLINPTRIEQVNEIVAQGEKMPQKSTFFYPKLLSGLVINKINPEPRSA